MAGLTNYAASKLYRHTFRGEYFPAPTVLRAALLRSWTLDDITGATLDEVAGVGRPIIAFQEVGAADVANVGTVRHGPFGPSPGDPSAPGPIIPTALAIVDQLSGGNALAWSTLRVPPQPQVGDYVEHDPGDLRVFLNGHPHLGYDIATLSHLYAWGWAGRGGEYCTLTKTGNGGNYEIVALHDLAGLGNPFVNATADKEAGFDRGTVVTVYKSQLPCIGLHNFNDGNTHFANVYYLDTPMVAAGEFYLACAFANTRGSAWRDLWGTDLDNIMQLEQGSGDLTFRLGGGSTENIAVLPTGLVILEVWRDSSDVIHVRANGEDVGLGVTMSGTLTLGGFGWKGTGSSQWDDRLFELLCCNGLPSSAERTLLMEKLTDRWAYGYLDGTIAGITDDLAQKWAEHLFLGVPYDPAPTLYLALCSRAPLDSDSGAQIDEIVQTGYGGREAVTFGLDPRADGIGSNTSTHLYTAGDDWSRAVAHYAICDAASGGNVLAWGELLRSQILKTGNTLKINPGDLTLNCNAN